MAYWVPGGGPAPSHQAFLSCPVHWGPLVDGNQRAPVPSPHIPGIVLSTLCTSLISSLLSACSVLGPVPGAGDVALSTTAFVESETERGRIG